MDQADTKARDDSYHVFLLLAFFQFRTQILLQGSGDITREYDCFRYFALGRLFSRFSGVWHHMSSG